MVNSETHFVYELGPAIIPPKDIRTGNKIVRSNRVWAQLDTLLTSDTITEAMEISKARILYKCEQILLGG